LRWQSRSVKRRKKKVGVNGARPQVGHGMLRAKCPGRKKEGAKMTFYKEQRVMWEEIRGTRWVTHEQNEIMIELGWERGVTPTGTSLSNDKS
jgi:hypothetical protein